jgi:hypothetical protein
MEVWSYVRDEGGPLGSDDQELVPTTASCCRKERWW